MKIFVNPIGNPHFSMKFSFVVTRHPQILVLKFDPLKLLYSAGKIFISYVLIQKR